MLVRILLLSGKAAPWWCRLSVLPAGWANDGDAVRVEPRSSHGPHMEFAVPSAVAGTRKKRASTSSALQDRQWVIMDDADNAYSKKSSINISPIQPSTTTTTCTISNKGACRGPNC